MPYFSTHLVSYLVPSNLLIAQDISLMTDIA